MIFNRGGLALERLFLAPVLSCRVRHRNTEDEAMSKLILFVGSN